jgi:hypothetical protein
MSDHCLHCGQDLEQVVVWVHVPHPPWEGWGGTPHLAEPAQGGLRQVVSHPTCPALGDDSSASATITLIRPNVP